ncbi:MAG: hypothetical protein V7K77_04765 [Nostoc sp.]|uniref:hypothetical protein n=1 Tax=Nostoc sp. TaxID=1180 RepID=UPI002FFD1CD4
MFMWYAYRISNADFAIKAFSDTIEAFIAAHAGETVISGDTQTHSCVDTVGYATLKIGSVGSLACLFTGIYKTFHNCALIVGGFCSFKNLPHTQSDR